MVSRLGYIIRLFVILLAVFVLQKVLFMIVNVSLAAGAPLGQCLLALWHGLRLDIVTACYLVVLPILITLVSCVVRNLPMRAILRPYHIILSLCITVIFLSDTVLYMFWGAKLDANDLMYTTHPKDMLASLSWWSVIIILLLVVGITWLFALLLIKATPKRFSDHPQLWAVSLFLPLMGLNFLGMRGSVSESTANPSYAYFSHYAFCNHAALNPTFNMMHSLFKTQDLENEFVFMDEWRVNEVLADAFSAHSDHSDTLFTSSRPNFLVIIWESGGSAMVMNDSVAPNLWALKDEGVYFSNCYANNFRTDRGLVSILNGWQGLPTTSLMKRSDVCRRLPSLPHALRDVGYTSAFTYGGDIGFTNMKLYMSETGFDTVRGGDAFPKAAVQSAWGVPDHILLSPSLVNMSRPFLSLALTLSSHEPWEVPMRRLADKRQNAFAYTDSCIGAMVSALRTSPLWDSLVVIILPDHGVVAPGVSSIASPRAAKMPIVMVGGAVKQSCTFDMLMSQSDLVATLLVQLGIDITPFSFSRNVLSAHYPSQHQFAMHAYKNGLNMITPTDTLQYDCVNRRPSAKADTSLTVFTEALLQRIYQSTARL
ncbi:MAG: sulfatase-like hydrolase/transferase [Bacteroidales bacterium]|nr:sulfatase-like hydrolase/transferase [Bacteroidales bacterium]